MNIEFTHAQLGVNGEPEHNTDSIFCWCAPRLQRVEGTDTDAVIHRTLSQVVESAVVSQREQLAALALFKTHYD